MSNSCATATQSWAEELAALNQRVKNVDVEAICLTPGWEKEKGGWPRLRSELERVQIIRTGLGWLSVDAVARVDRRLRAAGNIIDDEAKGRLSEAALNLCQAEHSMQRAWWSRHWNSWRCFGCVPVPPWWMILSFILLAALGATVWTILDRELFPRGEDLELPDALFAATLWGFGGALVNGMRTLHHRVQGQQFERERVAWYVISPVIGLAFGAIAFLLFLAGLLSTGQELDTDTATILTQQTASATKMVDPTPILVLALLAGFAQNAFIGAMQQIITARFRGAAEEEETCPQQRS